MRAHLAEPWVVGSYLAIVLTVIVSPSLWPVLLVALTVPTALRLIELARKAPDAPALNRLLRLTAGLHLRFGSLVTVGLLIHAGLDRV